MRKFKAAILGLVITVAVGASASILNIKKPIKKHDADVVLSLNSAAVLRGPVSDASVGVLSKRLRDLDKSDLDKPIYLVLYTPGGSIQAGIELEEIIKGLRRPVVTVTIFAASMGFQLAQALDERLIFSGGILMSHKASGGAEGEFGPGNSSQLDNRLGLWKRRMREMDEQTVKRSGGKQTLKSYQDAYENELWLTGSESVAQGYADRVITARCDDSLSGSQKEKTSIMGLEIEITFSSCPLQSSPEDVEMKIKTNQGLMTTTEFMNNGGVFGVDCSVAQSRLLPNKDGKILCAIDSGLSKDQIDRERNKIYDSYTIEGMKANIRTTW
jgi:ATP-dependent Clp protease, protease subunit